MGKAFLVISMTSHHIEEYRHPGYSTRRVQSYFLGSRKNRHAGKIRHIDFACHSEYSICRIMLPFNDVSYFTSCFWRKPYAKFNLKVFLFSVVRLSSRVYVLVRSSHRQAEFAVNRVVFSREVHGFALGGLLVFCLCRLAVVPCMCRDSFVVSPTRVQCKLFGIKCFNCAGWGYFLSSAFFVAAGRRCRLILLLWGKLLVGAAANFLV